MDETRPTPPLGYPQRYVIPIGIALVGIFIVSAGFLLGGEPAKFMTIGVEFLPFAVLAALAYGGVKNTTAMVFTYIWLAVLGLAILFNSFASVLEVYISPSFYSAASNQQPVGTPLDINNLFKPGAGAALLLTMLLLAVATAIAAAMLLRPVRVAISRIMPLDPDNFVHKIALVTVTLIFLTSFIPLVVLAGTPPILDLVNSASAKDLESMGVSVRPIDLIYQFVWMIPATFVAAGWPVARHFRAMLVRLGMVRPTLIQVGAGLGLGFVMALLGNYLIDPGIHALWTALGWQTTNVEAFGQLMNGVTNPIGAILVGVTAGIGEEMAVRGLLQPRFGLIASNLVFTSLHAFQYGVDALLSVFIIGLILGIIRARSNTSTSAIVHGTYDFVLVMMSVLGF